MLSVVAWKWGSLFGPEYVNRLQLALARHVCLPHQLWCVTDDARGIHPSVRTVPLPAGLSNTPRCRRRMRIFDREFSQQFGPRILSMDLDMVIVDDITPLLNRPEPVVGWQVDHANVVSGSFLLMDAGVLYDLWLEYFDAVTSGREGEFWSRIQPRGIPSDQAALNAYVNRVGVRVARWTRADGIVTYYGPGYERFEHLGVGPNRPTLPPDTRMVVLGSDDKSILDEGRFDWAREHWLELGAVKA